MLFLFSNICFIYNGSSKASYVLQLHSKIYPLSTVLSLTEGVLLVLSLFRVLSACQISNIANEQFQIHFAMSISENNFTHYDHYFVITTHQTSIPSSFYTYTSLLLLTAIFSIACIWICINTCQGDTWEGMSRWVHVLNTSNTVWNITSSWYQVN